MILTREEASWEQSEQKPRGGATLVLRAAGVGGQLKCGCLQTAWPGGADSSSVTRTNQPPRSQAVRDLKAKVSHYVSHLGAEVHVAPGQV